VDTDAITKKFLEDEAQLKKKNAAYAKLERQLEDVEAAREIATDSLNGKQSKALKAKDDIIKELKQKLEQLKKKAKDDVKIKNEQVANVHAMALKKKDDELAVLKKKFESTQKAKSDIEAKMTALNVEEKVASSPATLRNATSVMQFNVTERDCEEGTGSFLRRAIAVEIFHDKEKKYPHGPLDVKGTDKDYGEWNKGCPYTSQFLDRLPGAKWPKCQFRAQVLMGNAQGSEAVPNITDVWPPRPCKAGTNVTNAKRLNEGKSCAFVAKSDACVSKSCGKKCGKGCIDGKYIRLTRWQHNTRFLSEEEKQNTAKLDDEQKKMMYTRVSANFGKTLRNNFMMLANQAARYFPILCPNHMNTQNSPMLNQTKKVSMICERFCKKKYANGECASSVGEEEEGEESDEEVKEVDYRLGLGDSLDDSAQIGYGKKLKKDLKKVQNKVNSAGKKIKKDAKRAGKSVKAQVDKIVASKVKSLTATLKKKIGLLIIKRLPKDVQPAARAMLAGKQNLGKALFLQRALQRKGALLHKLCKMTNYELGNGVGPEKPECKPPYKDASKCLGMTSRGLNGALIGLLIGAKECKKDKKCTENRWRLPLNLKDAPANGAYIWSPPAQFEAVCPGDPKCIKGCTKSMHDKGPTKCTEKCIEQDCNNFLWEKLIPSLKRLIAQSARAIIGEESDVDTTMCWNWAPFVSTGTKEGTHLSKNGLSRTFGYHAMFFQGWPGNVKSKFLEKANETTKNKALWGENAFEIMKVQGDYSTKSTKSTNSSSKKKNNSKGLCKAGSPFIKWCRDWRYDTYELQPEKVVCAARFAVDIDVCNTCCCKHGIVKNRVSAILLSQNGHKQKPGCHPDSNPRLCQTPMGVSVGNVQKAIDVSKDGNRDNSIKFHRLLAIKLGDVPSEGQYPQCEAWFTIWDTWIRFMTGMNTVFTANQYHGQTRQDICKMGPKRGKFPEWCTFMDEKFMEGKGKDKEKSNFFPQGTGCLIPH